jgi:hypothetical protein
VTVSGVTAVKAVTLTPFHYHSLAVPSGTATLSTYLADRSMSYALAGAMGGLRPSVCLNVDKDYLRDMQAMTWLCSAFEAENPRLLPPIGKRLTLDAEGGMNEKILSASKQGNIATWFYIQEVPQDVVYHGAIFGPDPFEMASRAEGRAIDEIVVRTGRHLGGLVSLRRAEDAPKVRLNVHTASLFGRGPEVDDRLSVDVFALYDIQLTRPMDIEQAAGIVSGWRN